MPKLTVLTLDDAAHWDAVVHSFRAYDVYYLSGYARAFFLHGDGEPLLFYYEDAGLRGMNVVMRRDIAADPHLTGEIPAGVHFDMITPYGYGGWLIEGEGDTGSLYGVYRAWNIEHGVVSEFVRFHPVLENHVAASDFYTVVPLGETIAMDLTTSETIWANITSKNRNMIRKAQREGIHIYSGRSSALYEAFRIIYNETMDKDEAAAYYYFSPRFYQSILHDLPHNAQMFYAEREGEIIAGAIVLRGGDRLNYHLSGSKREFQTLAPTNLLLYQAALWGCENGCKTLHLGGGVGAGEDSLLRFKKAFYRGTPRRFYIGKRIFLPDVYDILCAQRGDIPDNGFFPRYRTYGS